MRLYEATIGLKFGRLLVLDDLGMKRRCTDSNSKGWPWYGGKGIKVCERWQDFNNFIQDMYPTYTDDLYIDRIDSNGDYCPENCRWVTHAEQFNVKLSLEQINAIIADPRSQPEIAEDYGINRSYVSMLKSGARTRHDPPL